MTVNGGSTGRKYFHVHKARPWGLVASAVGMTGLWATWLSAPDWTPLIALSLIFGSFVIVGLPAAVSGGCYRTWFADGQVHWECPSRLYGRNDRCRIDDLAEFQQLGGLGAGADPSEVISYRLVLRNGTIKPIEKECFGDRDAFLRALQKENRRVMFTQLAK